MKHPSRGGLAVSTSKAPLIFGSVAAILLIVLFELYSDSVTSLEKQLNSAATETRCAAAKRLAKKGSAARSALPALKSMLETTECVEFSHNTLPDLIQEIGGIDTWFEVMRSGGERARFSAAVMLELVAREHPERTPELKEAFTTGLQDKYIYTRQASINGLGILGTGVSDIVPELQNLLNDADPGTRAAAVEAINKIHSLHGLRAALSNPDEQIRNLAILKLGGVSAQEYALMRAGYNDELMNPELSDTGRQLMGKYAPPPAISEYSGYGQAVIPDLISALHDKSGKNSAAAAKGLSNLGSKALPALQALEGAALNSADRETRLEAIHALKNIGPEGLAPIEKITSSNGDEQIRDYAITVVGSYGEAGVPALASFLDRPWSPSSTKAVSVLGSLGRKALPALPALERTAAYAPDPAGRIQAIDALARIGPESSQAIEKAVSDPNSSVSAAARNALANMRGK